MIDDDPPPAPLTVDPDLFTELPAGWGGIGWAVAFALSFVGTFFALGLLGGLCR